MLNSWTMQTDDTPLKSVAFNPQIPNLQSRYQDPNLNSGPSRDDYMKYGWLFRGMG